MDYIRDIILYFSLGVLAVFARLLLALERVTYYSFFRAAVTGALVGVAIGTGFMSKSHLDPVYEYLIFGVAVSLAEDLIAGILNVGKQWRDDPYKVIKKYWRK
jgi:hypothetical protein